MCVVSGASSLCFVILLADAVTGIYVDEIGEARFKLCFGGDD